MYTSDLSLIEEVELLTIFKMAMIRNCAWNSDKNKFSIWQHFTSSCLSFYQVLKITGNTPYLGGQNGDWLTWQPLSYFFFSLFSLSSLALFQLLIYERTLSAYLWHSSWFTLFWFCSRTALIEFSSNLSHVKQWLPVSILNGKNYSRNSKLKKRKRFKNKTTSRTGGLFFYQVYLHFAYQSFESFAQTA